MPKRPSIKQLAEIDKKIANAEKEIAKLIQERSKEVEKLLTEKGKSWNQGGKYYQIRKRGDLYFLVSSDVKFGSWRKKENVAKKKETIRKKFSESVDGVGV